MINATQRFSGRAADYNQYRERYDAEILLPRLRTWCGLTSQWMIADIGAGTGMLGDIFLANGNQVQAVEPNADMREACSVLHTDNERLKVVAGTAEASTLPDQSIDLICMGRSFHWFDVDHAMAEFRRILRPDGWIVSVAFGRDQEGSEANIAVEAMLRSFTEDRVDTKLAYAKYARLQEFVVRDYHFEELQGAMELTKGELFGLLRSISHAPLPDDPRFSDLEQGTSEIFAHHAVGGHITLVTRYWINVGRF
jgi:SAM-dependent methyltransferase